MNKIFNRFTMSSNIDIKPGFMDLKNPEELGYLFDDFFEYTLTCLDAAEDADDFSLMMADQAHLLASGFTSNSKVLVVDDDPSGEKLAARLRNSLYNDGLLPKDSPVMLMAQPQEFVFMAAVLMSRQFMEMIRDCSEKNLSGEVIDLRRQALVKDWVDRFLGKGKYA